MHTDLIRGHDTERVKGNKMGGRRADQSQSPPSSLITIVYISDIDLSFCDLKKVKKK
jgi:hypothetical protein